MITTKQRIFCQPRGNGQTLSLASCLIPCLLSGALLACFATGGRAALTYVDLTQSVAVSVGAGDGLVAAGRIPVARLLSSVEVSVRDYLGLTEPNTLVRIMRRQTTLKTFKVRLKHQFGGYDVYGSGFVAETSATENLLYGVVQLPSTSSTSLLSGTGAVTPNISSAAAIATTAAAFGVGGASPSNKMWNQEARLVYYPSKGGTSSHRLCYMVKMYVSLPGLKSVVAPHAIVDASNGLVSSGWVQVSDNGSKLSATPAKLLPVQHSDWQ